MNGFTEEENKLASAHNKQTEMESLLLAKCFVCISRINMFTNYLGRDMLRNLECTSLYFLQRVFEYFSDDAVYNYQENGKGLSLRTNIERAFVSASTFPPEFVQEYGKFYTPHNKQIARKFCI